MSTSSPMDNLHIRLLKMARLLQFLLHHVRCRSQRSRRMSLIFVTRILPVFLVYSVMFLIGCFCGYLLSPAALRFQLVDDLLIYKTNSEEVTLEQSRHVTTATPRPETSTKRTPSGRQSKILCWVLTSPKNKFKAKIVKETWGRKCDKLLFMSSVNDTSLPAVGLPVEESRDMLWQKVKLSVHHLYAHYLHQYDWFFKADDDTFTIVENLRRFLEPYDSSAPHFFGREFNISNFVFFSGGAGYLLSREALRRIIESGFNENKCQSNSTGTGEDVNMSKCVREVNGTFGDSKDELGRQRFMPFRINDFYSGNGMYIAWMRNSGVHFKLGFDCCSEEAITFHYISGHDMQVYDYLLYRLHVANGAEY